MSLGPIERSRAASWLILATALSVSSFWLARGSLEPAGPVLFLVGVALFIYVPGALTLQFFLGDGREPNLFLAIAAGFPSGLAIYYLASRILPAHGYLAVTAAAAGIIALRRPDWLAIGATLPPPSRTLAASIGALLLLWPLSLTSFRSVESNASGDLSYLHATELENLKIGGSDAFFHAGVTSALSHSSHETRNPFLIGAPLAYHYGMDLLASAFDRELEIPPLDLAARLMPSLFVLTLSALVWQLARALGLSSTYGLLAVALTFASDFRLLLYLLPLHPEWSTRYWLSYFTAYPATSYYWANPQLPALVVFMGGLVVLAKSGTHLRGRVLAGLLLGATALFKVFLALHVAMALPLVAAISWIQSRRRDMVAVTAAAGALMVVVVAGNRLYGGSEVTFRWALLDPARASFRGVGLEPIAEVLDEVQRSPGVWTTLQTLAALAFYLFMVMGVRIVAVPFCLAVVAGGRDDSVRRFVCLFFLLGWIPPLVLVVSVSAMNNSFWFTNQSLFLGALLVALALAELSSKSLRRVALLTTLLFGLVPTWRDLAFRGSQAQARWPKGELEAALYFREHSDLDSVLLHPVNRETPSPASHIAGRSSVLTYWQGYPFSFAPRKEVEQRAADIGEFYRTRDPSIARAILNKYSVTWVYAPEARSLRFPANEILEEVFRNDEATLYRYRHSRNDGSAHASP